MFPRSEEAATTHDTRGEFLKRTRARAESLPFFSTLFISIRPFHRTRWKTRPGLLNRIEIERNDDRPRRSRIKRSLSRSFFLALRGMLSTITSGRPDDDFINTDRVADGVRCASLGSLNCYIDAVFTGV